MGTVGLESQSNSKSYRDAVNNAERKIMTPEDGYRGYCRVVGTRG